MTATRFNPLGALRTLVEHRVRFVVIGGFAGTLQGSSLITRDLDVCYSRDPENLERLAGALQQMKATLRGVDEEVTFVLDAQTISEGDTFTFDTTAGPLDIIGVPSGTTGFEGLMSNATVMDLGDGIDVVVASIDDLISMKRAAARPQDLFAVEVLAALQELIDAQETR